MIKIMKYGEVSPEEIFARGTAATDVSGIVRDIIDNVKENGDKAVQDYTLKFDGKLPEYYVTGADSVSPILGEVK